MRADSIRKGKYQDNKDHRRREESTEFKEVMAENFPNLEKEPDIQAHEAKRSLNCLRANKPSPSLILSEVKDKEFQVVRKEIKKIS